MPSAIQLSRRTWAALLGGAALAFVSYFMGAFAVDPIARAHAANELVLRRLGAGIQLFHGPDGRLLRSFVLGPLSAEVPVVLLHGLGATGDYFTLVTRELVKAKRTVILLDFAGSGGSERPAEPSGYGVNARVAAVASLLQALGLDRVDLVGHSLGGWTAGMFAIRQPESLRRLVLLDAGGFTLPGDPQATKAALEPHDRAGARHLLGLLFHRQPFPLAAGFTVNALGRSFRDDNVLVTLAQLDEKDGLLGREQELPAGTRLIWGEKDALFPLADARRLLTKLRDGRLYTITAVGHDPPIEAPRRFREALFRALDMAP